MEFTFFGVEFFAFVLVVGEVNVLFSFQDIGSVAVTMLDVVLKVLWNVELFLGVEHAGNVSV